MSNNNSEEIKKDNISSDTKKNKIDNSNQTESIAKLGTIKNVNLYNDIFKQIEIYKVLNNKEISILLNDKDENFTYTSIISFLDDILETFGEEKEKQILEIIFNQHLKYNVSFDISKVEPDIIILDLFNKDNNSSLSTKEREIIISSGILPIKIVSENKINKLIFVSRTPELPKNLLNNLKEILKREKIQDGELILIPKKIYNTIYNNLENQNYDYIL